MTMTQEPSRRRAARLAFRVMLSGIFLIAGANHLFRTGAITGRLEEAPLGDLVAALAPPEFLVLAVGVALLVGGLALSTGFATRWAAAGLIAVIIPITFVVQTAGLSTLGPLFKNIGLTGGLIYFAVHGPRSWSLDEFLRGGGRDGSARAAGGAFSTSRNIQDHPTNDIDSTVEPTRFQEYTMSMRRLFGAVLVTLFAAGATGCATANGETGDHTRPAAETAEVKAALGVREPKHVAVATMTARQMLSGEAEQSADEVVIVACGPALRQLADGSERADIVREGLVADVQYRACGVTVERMGFDASTFIDGVEVVPNGFVELIRLQEQGFHTIEL